MLREKQYRQIRACGDSAGMSHKSSKIQTALLPSYEEGTDESILFELSLTSYEWLKRGCCD